MKEQSQEDSLIKEVKKIDLWSWIRIFIVILLIVGSYAWGVIEGSRFSPKYGYDKSKYNRMELPHNMRKPNVQMMVQDPMDMSMRDMSTMLAGKTGDELNKAFLESMIPHHQGAIDMAKYLAGSDKPELVKLGADITATQQKEIEQMQKWMIEWGYISTGSTNSGALSPQVEMMQEHCKQMPEMAGCTEFR